MQYRSTRGFSPEVDSAQAVLTGLAPDGGLYLPCTLPAFAWQDCIQKDTVGIAEMILSAFLPDIPDMPALVKKAYTGKFETEDLTPTVPVGDFHVLELFRGPTSSWVDRTPTTSQGSSLPSIRRRASSMAAQPMRQSNALPNIRSCSSS